jgi:hypothetical protein
MKVKTIFLDSGTDIELLTIPFLFAPTEVSVVEIDNTTFNIEDITDQINVGSITRLIYLCEI